MRQSPVSTDVNTEAEESTALGAVARPQPVNTQQTKEVSTCCSELQGVRISDSAEVTYSYYP
jgi:hypothetical protein